ncbi:MAG: hypothetical protein MUF49_16655 [Oculatellaceae cyanobacterium Prado106]|nr:hypothetical protein [Oculatellaceae cyanobacterium Prado106]
MQELRNLVRDQPENFFDVFHLTGHGIIYTEADYGWALRQMANPPSLVDYTPCFTTEDEVGNLQLTTVADLARAFGDRFPRVIFLSGGDGRSGQESAGGKALSAGAGAAAEYAAGGVDWRVERVWAVARRSIRNVDRCSTTSSCISIRRISGC